MATASIGPTMPAASCRASANTIWSSAHDRPRRRRPHARRFGNGALNWLASYLTGREIPDLTSGFRGARREYLREFIHLLPNGFSTPTTTTLAFIKAGYNVVFEPVEARSRVGAIKDPPRARRGEVPDDHSEDRHALQPAAHLPAAQPGLVRARRRVRACGRSRRRVTSRIRRCSSSCSRSSCCSSASCPSRSRPCVSKVANSGRHVHRSDPRSSG